MAPAVPTNRPLSVLVVDDVSDAASSTAELLALHGYATRVAAGGEAALRAAAAHPPDVVLIDLVMPGIDGYELARRLRIAADGAHPYLIAVTGREREQDRQQSADAGIDEFLVKPVAPEVLLGALGRARGGRNSS